MKIGVIGDAHFKDKLSYSEYITDGRVTEKKQILDFIVESFKDCDQIVLLGDNFHSKNNSSEVNREFVEFIERFKSQVVYIIAGNHEKKGDGKTAIDFLGEVDKSNWHIISKPKKVSIVSTRTFKFDFLPYMLNSELGVENNEEATKKIMSDLTGGDILFTHHNITGTFLHTGVTTESTNNVVLPREELEKRYKLIVAGDIHAPQQYGHVLISGSLFTSEVGELEKFIWKIDDQMNIEKIKVPGREIHKLINPRLGDIGKITKYAIVKIIITDKSIDLEAIKIAAGKFDAHLIIEDYPDERKKMHIEQGAMDFSIESLLKLYSEQKNVDYQKLIHGLELVNAN